MSSAARRTRINALRAAGYQAARAGASRGSVPRDVQGPLDRIQWLSGYDAASAAPAQVMPVAKAVAAEMRQYLDQDVDPSFDTLESWATRLEGGE